MEFKINRVNFEKTLASIVKLIPPKSTHTVLQNIIIEAKDNKLNIEGTDLDIFIQKSLTCDLKKAGKALLPGKKLLEIARESNVEEMYFKLKELNLQINVGNAQFNIPALDYNEFPEVPSFPSRRWINLSAGELNEMVDSTIFMVSKDVSRRAMNGVFLQLKNNTLNMVTTDGARLALYRKELKAEDGELIVPPKVFDLLDINQSEDPVELFIEERMVGLKFSSTSIIARLIEGPYPNYESVIPKVFPGICTVEKDILEGALKRVSLVSSPSIKSVKFDFSGDKLLLSASSADFGEAKEEVPCLYEGEKMSVWFNAGFLLEIIRHTLGNDIVLQLTSPSTAALIKAKGLENLIYLLMPLRIDSYE
ncbi:MAG: DNA polymerase III subunit beta [candidate division WOR-3 bacterium]|nr:DNA polymerase III subunit beta [candidate division WOR-3 bacterium]